MVGRDARRQFAGVANYKARYESVERFRIFSSFQFSSPSSASSLFLLLSSFFIHSIIYLFEIVSRFRVDVIVGEGVILSNYS